ncbi:hypothetical protein EDC96DRAFT_541246 [Choanephora cucurbitarum]|nr:hypothetical protein EDC96DRAFT_541246 [Choanephora cucurbitarum]
MTEHQDKLVRRKILSEIKDWNLGISLTGLLATEACFVHQSVPEIGTIKELSKSQFSMATQSKWTENLVQSGVSNPYDTITIKSLSVCYSILKSSKDSSLICEESQKKLHALSFRATALVQMNQIARLTQDFEDDLDEARGHWPLQPQKSWDKLYLIWTKFGFLWPEKLYLEFKQQEHNHLAEGPRYKLWRAQLRPLYEFFPESHHAARDFMIDIIRYFTPLVMYTCPFRLCNVKTNTYLAKTDTLSIQMLNSAETQPSNLLWTFQTTSHAPFVFTDTKAWILPENDSLALLLTKDTTRPLHHQPIQLSPIEHASLNNLHGQGWALSTLQHSAKKDAPIHFDSIIHQLRCLNDGDIITLSQDGLYLRTERSYLPQTHSPLLNNSIESIQSLSSIASTNRSSHLDPSASNSTQPTAVSSQTQSPSSPIVDRLDEEFNSIVYLERLADAQNAQHGKEYQWRVELMPPWDSQFLLSDTESIELVVPAGLDSESFKSFSIESDRHEPISQWLDGNPKLYQIYHVSKQVSPASSSIQDDQFNTPEGSYRSIQSVVDLSDRKREKLPLQTRDTFDPRMPNDSPNQQDDTISSNPLEPHKAPSSCMSEAEEFKREVQQTYQDNKVYEAIYNNIFQFSTPSTFTSSGHIRYYDNDHHELAHQNRLLNSRTSHPRSMNTTPHSKQSQYTSSTVIANLTPEEYLARKQLRENSFLLLVPQETKQQIWLKAMKQSTLGHWFKSKKSDVKIEPIPIYKRKKETIRRDK